MQLHAIHMENNIFYERDLNHKDKQNLDAVLDIIHASCLLDGNSHAYATISVILRRFKMLLTVTLIKVWIQFLG